MSWLRIFACKDKELRQVLIDAGLLKQGKYLYATDLLRELTGAVAAIVDQQAFNEALLKHFGLTVEEGKRIVKETKEEQK